MHYGLIPFSYMQQYFEVHISCSNLPIYQDFVTNTILLSAYRFKKGPAKLPNLAYGYCVVSTYMHKFSFGEKQSNFLFQYQKTVSTIKTTQIYRDRDSEVIRKSYISFVYLHIQDTQTRMLMCYMSMSNRNHSNVFALQNKQSLCDQVSSWQLLSPIVPLFSENQILNMARTNSTGL